MLNKRKDYIFLFLNVVTFFVLQSISPALFFCEQYCAKQIINWTVLSQDESFDFSVYMDSISEHCAATSTNDITGLVTLRCPDAEVNEATGSVVLTQASLTVDDGVYNILLTENGNHNSFLCTGNCNFQDSDPICFCRCCSPSAVWRAATCRGSSVCRLSLRRQSSGRLSYVLKAWQLQRARLPWRGGAGSRTGCVKEWLSENKKINE